MSGSSPLTRGTLRRAPAKRPRNRFIPAYAGNSAGFYVADFEDFWFIPAYAGNSLIEWPLPVLHEVHPRLRGELDSALRGDLA